MKKLSILAAAALITAAAPAIAEEVPADVDPFTQMTTISETPAIAIIGGVAVLVAIAASSGTS
jgi:hypothetical protein